MTIGEGLFSLFLPAFAAVPQDFLHITVGLLGRVATHLAVRSPHRSPPADFPHEPLQPLIHSTARDCILRKGTYSLGRRNGNDSLILWNTSQVILPRWLRLESILRQ